MQKIIVIGGGASGMTAAIIAARKGAEVTILEQNERPGKKILSTGNGRCNLTNLQIMPDCYRGDDPLFIQESINHEQLADDLEFFKSLGILIKCRGDYIYPLCDQASAVRDALELELKQLGVTVITGMSVERIRKGTPYFQIYCKGKKECYLADRVILACGSKASQVAGSDGSGYTLAESLGHSISPVVPALTALHAEGKYFKKLAGIRTGATVSLYIDNQYIAGDTGELQFTDYGISGIPVFQVSRYASKALLQHRNVTACLDLVPTLTKTDFCNEMDRRKECYSHRSAEECFNSILPSKLTPVLLNLCGIDRKLWAFKIPEDKWERMLELCKDFQVTITSVNDFKKAQVCAGGVKTNEINPDTMESRLVKGLYITGELLDVDGICGGYNLHFAWATGMLAGNAAAEEE